jgi:glycerophosphoryl diester phosphodiesterase
VVYLELKDPAYFASIGLSEEPLLVDALRTAGLDHRDAPVFVESFDASSLRRVRNALAVPLIQLMWAGTPGDGVTSEQALRETAQYATGVGVQRVRLRFPGKAETDLDGLDRAMVEQAHRAGLEVHVYTFDDIHPAGKPGGVGKPGEPIAVYQAYYSAGVDGVFTNRPDAALQARDMRPPDLSEATTNSPEATDDPAEATNDPPASPEPSQLG